MSKIAKTILVIIVLIVIVWVIWWIAGTSSSAPVSSAPVSAAVDNAIPAAAITANSSVDSDLNAIDGQMNGLSQDTASADQSIASSSAQ